MFQFRPSRPGRSDRRRRIDTRMQKIGRIARQILLCFCNCSPPVWLGVLYLGATLGSVHGCVCLLVLKGQGRWSENGVIVFPCCSAANNLSYLKYKPKCPSHFEGWTVSVQVKDAKMLKSFFGRNSTACNPSYFKQSYYSVPILGVGLLAVLHTADFLIYSRFYVLRCKQGYY